MRVHVRRLGTAIVVLVAGALLASFSAAPDVVRVEARHRRVAPGPALFSHVEHRSFSCYGCHPGLFSTPRAPITHKAMNAGQYCGACHDGRAAPSTKQLGCTSCHAD